MHHSRRHFIKTAGIGSLGTGFLPAFAPLTALFEPLAATGLPRSSPELQGVQSKGIHQFVAAANAAGPGWHSFMLLRHGHVIAEAWWAPFAPAYRHTLYSLSKSFTSTAIGLLVKEGKLTVEDKVISFFPDHLPAAPHSNLLQMKVKHLLTMNTGHAEDTMPQLRASANEWTNTFLAQPVTFEPGTHFLYNTGASYMLGAIVYKITGQTLEAYLGPRLFQPLEIKGYDWEKSPQGLNTAGYGLRIKTEDIARFGQLYLQKGKWKGKEILPENWVHEATSYQTKSQEGSGDWSQGYGYQFWRCKPGFYRGDGAYGQFCIVMPEQDVVLAITSESWDMQKSMTTVWENLLPAIQPGILPENKEAFAALQAELKTLSLPVMKGIGTGPLQTSCQGKTFLPDSNIFSATGLSFSFSDKTCTLTVKTAQKDHVLQFGWESWLTGKDNAEYIFKVPGRIHMPSKMAGTATWITANTLQLNARFVEAMHGDTITCVFNENTVTLSFLNSVSEHSKTDTEKRIPLTGKLL